MTRSQKMSAQLAVAVAALAGPIGYALAQPADAPAQQADQAAKPLAGTVKAYNLNPRGDADGLIVDVGDGKPTLVSFPPHLSATIEKAAAVGDAVKLTATPKPTRSGVAVYELVSLTGKDGQPVAIASPGGKGDAVHVEGDVASLNYGRGGEVNGAILADGTFVHVGPREAEEIGLAVGQKLVVDGTGRATASGRKVVDATNVNGTEIERPAPGPKGERHAPGPKGERKPR